MKKKKKKKKRAIKRSKFHYYQPLMQDKARSNLTPTYPSVMASKIDFAPILCSSQPSYLIYDMI